MFVNFLYATTNNQDWSPWIWSLKLQFKAWVLKFRIMAMYDRYYPCEEGERQREWWCLGTIARTHVVSCHDDENGKMRKMMMKTIQMKSNVHHKIPAVYLHNIWISYIISQWNCQYRYKYHPWSHFVQHAVAGLLLQYPSCIATSTTINMPMNTSI
jgi:hypothetical protein